MDVGVELLKVKGRNERTSEDRRNQNGSLERRRKLFGMENGMEIMWIGVDVVTTSSFKIDIPASSKSVGFCV